MYPYASVCIRKPQAPSKGNLNGPCVDKNVENMDRAQMSFQPMHIVQSLDSDPTPHSSSPPNPITYINKSFGKTQVLLLTCLPVSLCVCFSFMRGREPKRADDRWLGKTKSRLTAAENRLCSRCKSHQKEVNNKITTNGVAHRLGPRVQSSCF